MDLRWATITVTCSPPARTVADRTPRPSAADRASFSGVAGSSKIRSRDCTGTTPSGKVVISTRFDRRRGDSSATRMPRPSGTAGETIVEVDAARRVEVGEHLLGADFLQGKHVGLDGVDDLGEASDLVVVLLLRRRSVPVADREQVLDVPRHHRQIRHDPCPPDRPRP